MSKATSKNPLWGKLSALRAVILSFISEGVSDNDERVLVARRQQRLIGEELVRRDESKGVAFEREGDLHRVQRGMARKFGVAQARPQEEIDAEEGKPPAQIVVLKTLSFRSEAEGIVNMAAPPNLTVGLEALRMESRAPGVKSATLSVLEGSIGVDYVVDKDPESEITFYVPITGGSKDGD